MGQIDIDSLMMVYRETVRLADVHSLPFSFSVDHGTYETAIEFVGNVSHHPPMSKNWDSNPTIFCPDLLDFHNKIIIEWEEEVGNRRPGAKLAKKGHNREGDMDTKRDSRRTQYYKSGKFRVLRIYESDKMWKEKLEAFLLSINEC